MGPIFKIDMTTIDPDHKNYQLSDMWLKNLYKFQK